VPDDLEVHAAKTELRRKARDARAAAFRTHGPTAAERVAICHDLAFTATSAGAIVSAFLPIGEELDPLPFLLRAQGDGYRFALPVMVGKGQPLIFRQWRPGDPVKETRWGIREPLESAPEVEPQIVLTPLLAFDRRGYRLGYGGGFYDRTLAVARVRRPVVAIGLAYDEQEVDEVPHLDYDQRLDWILTPSRTIRCVTS
jgi:5-formyltetrahydrofolate cyclo-ligase